MNKKSRLAPGARVWITARHSPGKSQSIEAQLATLRDYCAENRLVIAHEFVDKGISGNDYDRRDQFAQMLEIIEASKKPLVIVDFEQIGHVIELPSKTLYKNT